MNIFFLLLPCTWLITGGGLFLSSAQWDLSSFDRPDFLLFSALWVVLGLIITGILVLGFLHLPVELQGLIRSGAQLLDTLPAKNERRSNSLQEKEGLLTLRNVIAYKVIDPFGQREARAQAQEQAQWRQTQALHE